MAVWMELRCDGRNEPGYPDDCWSHTNSGPQEMANNSKGSVDTHRRILQNQAAEAGWVVKRVFVWCPACAKHKGFSHV